MVSKSILPAFPECSGAVPCADKIEFIFLNELGQRDAKKKKKIERVEHGTYSYSH